MAVGACEKSGKNILRAFLRHSRSKNTEPPTEKSEQPLNQKGVCDKNAPPH